MAAALAIILTQRAGVAVTAGARLGRTLRAWRAQALAYFDTAGLSNGRTEAINLLIEKARRLAHGYRSFTNYRLRMLLAASGQRPYWRTTDTRVSEEPPRQLKGRGAARAGVPRGDGQARAERLAAVAGRAATAALSSLSRGSYRVTLRTRRDELQARVPVEADLLAAARALSLRGRRQLSPYASSGGALRLRMARAGGRPWKHES